MAAEATGDDFAYSAIQSATVYLYNTALEEGSVYEEESNLKDIKIEGEWQTLGAVGDLAATLIDSVPNLLAGEGFGCHARWRRYFVSAEPGSNYGARFGL